ncbi:UV DNA damage repair endonuclease UvsE [Oceanobacillus halophilus]|uniref:UV DNA damage repair endonuclease UvsE n=1 Tax=Oceanobacillus halophilus TaxID=930130 RepID=A0A494ZR37_9BACI|nr:UV DNA damage repair endonuclease UvsE [Oceanobacillus halophilus]RKQ28178.1 UV DNA damage repair endonuclease UvsE [Oceanobacillus halophilus]
MKIRFGYVANALGLWDASPSKTLTFARYSKLPKSERLDTLKSVTAKNLHHTKRILCYNIAHEIELYRFSSMLVPLATHPEARWDFVTPFKKEWKELGRLVKKYNIRTSFHPGQYTLFTSPREEVTMNAVEDMQYHYQMLEAMGILDTSIMNIHVGGAYGNKEKTLERFHENLKQLPNEVQYYMTLENDDKTYNIEETLKACEKEKIPMILDYHHYMANKGEVELEDYLERIFNTWKHRDLVPKVHISSPKGADAFRSHADYVDLVFVQPFLKIAKELNQDFDMMIEAKQKNLAMHQLVEEIAKIRGVKRLSGASVEY